MILIFSCSISLAQTDRDDIQRQIDELMKARSEMLNSLLNDNGFKNFEKRFEDMIKNFDQNGTGLGVDIGGPVVGEYDWRVSDTQMIFVLKVKQIKDRPLDIKIEKGMIRLKGDVESTEVTPFEKSSKNKTRTKQTVTKVHFERAFSIPDGLDQTNPEFETLGDELLIKFKKLAPKKKKNPNPEQLHPVEKDANDLTI